MLREHLRRPLRSKLELTSGEPSDKGLCDQYLSVPRSERPNTFLKYHYEWHLSSVVNLSRLRSYSLPIRISQFYQSEESEVQLVGKMESFYDKEIPCSKVSYD
jgi:hypothetical protein